MENHDRIKHWENIYDTKPLEAVSWYETIPETSLKFLKAANLSKTSKIIDVGGGDSFFVDYLLELGYEDISILDISSVAIARAKKRLGDKAHKVKWIIEDITHFKAAEKYDFWHDRAAFHFLTNENEITAYIENLTQSVNKNGNVVMGTFSNSGPTKCSGIEIKQYSEELMIDLFKNNFEKVTCLTVDHKTPFNTIQNFTFCHFRKN